MPKTILVVEDDEAIQELLKEALEGLGHHVVGEKDGGAAVKAFDRQPADLCILDMLVPVLNGMQVAERIRAHPRGADVPLVMMSGIYRGAKHRKEAADKVGALAYLEKPLDLAALTSVVSRALEGEADAALEPELLGDVALGPDLPTLGRSSLTEAVPEVLQRGDLGVTPFPELLGWLFRGHHTGALLLRREHVKKIVYVREGVPTNVKSNLLSECLGKILVRERMLNDADCELSIKRMQETGRQQGTILVEAGLLSPANLVFALQLQLEAKLYEIFTWSHGDYQFAPREEMPPATVGLDTTLGNLIAEGLKRHWDGARVKARLKDWLPMYLAPHPDPLLPLSNLPVPAADAALLEGLDGTRTLQDVLGAGAPDARARMLYLLLAAQAVELREHAARDARSGPPPLKKPGKDGAAASTPPPLKRPGTAPLYAGAEPPRRDSGETEKLAARLKELRRLTHFEVLGVSRSATADELRRAYFTQAKEVHPDRHAGRAAADVKAVADQVYALLSTAYAVLSDGRARDQYTRGLSHASRSAGADAVAKQLQTDALVQRGEGLLRRRDWVRAHESFHQAAELSPEDPTVLALLGWSLFQTHPADPEVSRQAEQHLERAVALATGQDRPHLLMGLLYKSTGRRDQAERQFEKALECNPDCGDARRELKPRANPVQPPPLAPRLRPDHR